MTAPIPNGTTRLVLIATETPEGLLGSFNYNTDLFDPQTIERLIVHFSRLLDAIVAHPARPLAESNYEPLRRILGTRRAPARELEA